MSESIPSGVYIEIDGARLRASADSLRYFPLAVRYSRRTGGFFYDDGTTSEWFAHEPGGRNSDYRFVFDDGVGPKVHPETDFVDSEVSAWISACHDARVLPVLQLIDDGSIGLDDANV